MLFRSKPHMALHHHHNYSALLRGMLGSSPDRELSSFRTNIGHGNSGARLDSGSMQCRILVGPDRTVVHIIIIIGAFEGKFFVELHRYHFEFQEIIFDFLACNQCLYNFLNFLLIFRIWSCHGESLPED